MTELEPTLRRLLRLCPDIVLEKREIELIIDGNTNKVITEYKAENAKFDAVLDSREDTQTIEPQEEHPEDCDVEGCCVDPSEEDADQD